MSDRRGGRPVGATIALISIAVACAVGALVMTYVASMLQLQLNEYYAGTQGVPSEGGPTQAELNTLSSLAYSLSNFAAPLLTAAFIAVFGLLALLAVRWQRLAIQAETASEELDVAAS